MIVRNVTEADVPILLRLVRELAAYEREPDAVDMEEQQLVDVLFTEAPVVFATVAEEDGDVLGTAIYFRNFSTWTGRLGIYLEDLYVLPEARGRGVGHALLTDLARTAMAHGYARVDWSVLDWNETAIGFYRSIGAVPMDGWTGYRLTGEALAALGSTDHREE